jgi:serine/threonine-protein kinase
VYDYGRSEDGAFFYVMELLDGMSVDVLIRRHGPITAERAVYLLMQVCHSLGEAHQRALIHRDIKPANIFVCRLGPDFDFVKVLDFGLVKGTTADLPDTELTATGAAAGTPRTWRRRWRWEAPLWMAAQTCTRSAVWRTGC